MHDVSQIDLDRGKALAVEIHVVRMYVLVILASVDQSVGENLAVVIRYFGSFHGSIFSSLYRKFSLHHLGLDLLY